MLKFLAIVILTVIRPCAFLFGKFCFLFGAFYNRKIEHLHESRKVLLRQCENLEKRVQNKKAKRRVKDKYLIVFLFKVLIFASGRLNLWLVRQTSIPILLFAAMIIPILKYLNEIRHNSEISAAPGSTLLKIVDFFYQKEIVKGVFEQLVGDWREEYFETVSEKRNFKAQWVSVRWRFIFYRTMFMQSPIGEFIEFFKQFVK